MEAEKGGGLGDLDPLKLLRVSSENIWYGFINSVVYYYKKNVNIEKDIVKHTYW